MDFATYIRERNGDEFDAAQRRLVDEAERAQRIAVVRRGVVTRKVQTFAESLAMDYEELSGFEPALFYTVGGFVFRVRAFDHISPAKRELVRPGDVLWQYRVALVGFDLTGRTDEVSIGTLALLSPEGVRQAVHDKRAFGLEFSAEGVVPVLRGQ